MCRYKLHGCWFGGVAIGQSGRSVGQLIKVGLVKLVERQGLPTHRVLGPGGKGVAVLVGERLTHMETSFLEGMKYRIKHTVLNIKQTSSTVTISASFL